MHAYNIMMASGIAAANTAAMSLDVTLYLIGLGVVIAGLSFVMRRIVNVARPEFALSKHGGKVIGGGTGILSAGSLALTESLAIIESAAFGVVAALIAAGVWSLAPDGIKNRIR